MKVAHLTTIDLTLRFLLLPQLAAVRDLGGEAIGISAPGPWVKELEESGIRHLPLRSSTRGMNILADLRAARQLWSILREERPDILHTHNPKPGLYGRILGRLAGVPTIVNTVHGLYAAPEDRLSKRLLVYGLEAVASRFSDAELVQSREDFDLMMRWRISPPSRTRLLGNGVDLDRFDPGRFRGDRESIREELGLNPDQIVVGMVGRLVVEKGFLELFAAARLLDERFRVICIGPDDPEKGDAISAESVQLADGAGVAFLGMRADVERLYAAMDVFALPTHREGFPRAAMEASAMGLPVVASNVRGCREVVEDGVTGILVPVRDPAALAAALQRLGSDPALRERLGAAAHRKAMQDFDERQVVSKVIGCYREVAQSERVITENTLEDGPSVPRARYGYCLSKRVLDLAIGSVALVLLSPVIAAVGVLIRVTMGRPVLFKQARPGLGARAFRIYKFRTMRPVDDHGAPAPDAERLTRVGWVLRRWSLDELPELFNVLSGEMSLVGPRPLLMEYLDRYTPEQARRHEVKPGITGWAQINGRNNATWEERFRLDVWYVDHRSLRLDMKILLTTVRKVLSGEGVTQSGRATVDYFRGTENDEG